MEILRCTDPTVTRFDIAPSRHNQCSRITLTVETRIPPFFLLSTMQTRPGTHASVDLITENVRCRRSFTGQRHCGAVSIGHFVMAACAPMSLNSDNISNQTYLCPDWLNLLADMAVNWSASPPVCRGWCLANDEGFVHVFLGKYGFDVLQQHGGST